MIVFLPFIYRNYLAGIEKTLLVSVWAFFGTFQLVAGLLKLVYLMKIFFKEAPQNTYPSTLYS